MTQTTDTQHQGTFEGDRYQERQPDEWRPYTPGRRWRHPHLGIKAEGFRWGHRMGRTDCARRLWPHLTDEGRQLAAVIAAEGEDAGD
ncbi:hypothetical protein [Mycobacterium paraffinicum]|nr:hypothetical protein [Mycobacterium paraffinicum]MCV7311020.1 hypothetical protein [Mycobacterium paraffinicum]